MGSWGSVSALMYQHFQPEQERQVYHGLIDNLFFFGSASLCNRAGHKSGYCLGRNPLRAVVVVRAEKATIRSGC